jgi:hypothetical protein
VGRQSGYYVYLLAGKGGYEGGKGEEEGMYMPFENV